MPAEEFFTIGTSAEALIPCGVINKASHLYVIFLI